MAYVVQNETMPENIVTIHSFFLDTTRAVLRTGSTESLFLDLQKTASSLCAYIAFLGAFVLVQSLSHV